MHVVFYKLDGTGVSHISQISHREKENMVDPNYLWTIEQQNKKIDYRIIKIIDLVFKN